MFIENQIYWHELGLSDLTLLGNNESEIFIQISRLRLTRVFK